MQSRQCFNKQDNRERMKRNSILSSKITKIPNSGKFKTKTSLTMENNDYIPDYVVVFPYAENGGLQRVLQLAKPLTFMTVA